MAKRTSKSSSKRKVSKAETYAKQGAEQIAAMKDNVALFRKQVSEMRTLVRKRASRINKGYKETSEGVTRIIKPYSYALDKYQEAKKNRGKVKPVNKMNYLELVSEWRRLSAFIQAATSTLSGIKEVNYNQDSLIFGNTKYVGDKPVGTPLGTLTQEERKVFWSLYEAFKSGKDNMYALLGSNKVITEIGALVNDRENKTFKMLLMEQAALSDGERDLISLFNYAKRKLEGAKELDAERRAEEEYEDEYDVYNGPGPSLPF